MSLKPVYNLESVTHIDDNHTLLVYQDNRLKKINRNDIFYTKKDIENNVIKQKNDITKALQSLGINISDDTPLSDLVSYINKPDLLEIGVRRVVHNGNGTDIQNFHGEPSYYNNPKFINMGIPQDEPWLDRCYKIGKTLTVQTTKSSPDANTDPIYAGISSPYGLKRNDFYGGEYSSDNWKSGIYPWNSMEKICDDHGNYFTKVPLYYIKEEFVTENGVDISDTYPLIPTECAYDKIYKYTFVSKLRYPGYRPAEFFYDYKENKMIEDANGEYIYLEDLECYTIPISYGTNIRYSLSNNKHNSGEYTKILTREHYFSCYEASTDGDTIIRSIPNVTPAVGKTMTEFRTLCKNTDSSYFIRDIRSFTDFFSTLFTIEFATTDSQSIAYGVTNSSAISKTGLCDNIDFRTATSGSDYVSFKWNWIENPYGNIYKYIDGFYINLEEDEDGYNLNSGKLYENCIYVSNNPLLYTQENYSKYSKLRYIMPSMFFGENNARTSSNGITSQLGYDSLYPWCQVTSKCGKYDNLSSYCDAYYQASEIMDSGTNTKFDLVQGGCYNMVKNNEKYTYAGLHCFNISNQINSANPVAGISFQKTGR